MTLTFKKNYKGLGKVRKFLGVGPLVSEVEMEEPQLFSNMCYIMTNEIYYNILFQYKSVK